MGILFTVVASYWFFTRYMAMGRLVEANSMMPLPELAELILKETRSFGKQFDDQTLLLVWRTAA